MNLKQLASYKQVWHCLLSPRLHKSSLGVTIHCLFVYGGLGITFESWLVALSVAADQVSASHVLPMMFNPYSGSTCQL